MSRQLVDLDWTAGASPEVGFPAHLVTGVSDIRGVLVVKVRDVLDAAAIRYEAVQVAGWSSSANILKVSYLTGLEPLRRYIITLEVIGA